MTDHAHELRRHAGKIGLPAGDTPAVMHAAAAHIEDLERRLREAEARVAELESERAEREAGKLLAYLSNDRTQFFIPSMEGKYVKHAPYMAHWMAGWTPLYAATPVTAQVRLNDSEMEMIARAHGTGGWQTLDDMVRFARAIETAVLRANGFDIQPTKGKD